MFTPKSWCHVALMDEWMDRFFWAHWQIFVVHLETRCVVKSAIQIKQTCLVEVGRVGSAEMRWRGDSFQFGSCILNESIKGCWACTRTHKTHTLLCPLCPPSSLSWTSRYQCSDIRYRFSLRYQCSVQDRWVWLSHRIVTCAGWSLFQGYYWIFLLE